MALKHPEDLDAFEICWNELDPEKQDGWLRHAEASSEQYGPAQCFTYSHMWNGWLAARYAYFPCECDGYYEESNRTSSQSLEVQALEIACLNFDLIRRSEDFARFVPWIDPYTISLLLNQA
jgi:hypothetical protein